MQPGSPLAGGAAAGKATAGCGGNSTAPSAAAAAAAGKQRTADLEAFAQQQCLQLVQQLAGNLQQRLQGLPTPVAGVQGAADVEQVLLLARLCTALGAGSCMLPAVLGPTDAWPAAVKAGPHARPPGSGSSASGGMGSTLPACLAQGVGALGPAAAALLRMHHPGLQPGQASAAGAAGAGAASQLAVLQQQLHSIACGGYATWAAWVAASLGADLAAGLASDELLCSDSTPLSWTEVKMAADGGGLDVASTSGLYDLLDDAAAAGDMCFALPACPSAAMMQMLNRACWVS